MLYSAMCIIPGSNVPFCGMFASRYLEAYIRYGYVFFRLDSTSRDKSNKLLLSLLACSSISLSCFMHINIIAFNIHDFIYI
jgi:hypothetical protein